MARKPSLQVPEGDPDTLPDVADAFADPRAQRELPLPVGTLIGPYEVERLLGRGGGGAVYAARGRGAEVVAVKLLRADMARFPSMITRFLREVELVRRIAHPNIVAIHEVGEYQANRPYYAMELLDGTDLRKLLQQHGRFTPRELLALLEPVCHAVGAAHARGVVHRDIKANNVMVVQREGARVVKLLDFGIAKMLHADTMNPGRSEPGALLGTAHFMAPEQIRCERPDARTDIYALGVLSYQLLTGQYPFHADEPRQVALQHLQVPAPRPSALAPVPRALDAVVLRCMEKSADQRFPDAAALLGALRTAVGEDQSVEGLLLELGSCADPSRSGAA